MLQLDRNWRLSRRAGVLSMMISTFFCAICAAGNPNGGWDISSPKDTAKLVKTNDVNSSGVAAGSGINYTVEIADTNGVVRGSANGISVLGMPDDGWGVTVTKPMGGNWDITLNPYTITCRATTGAEPEITVTFVN